MRALALILALAALVTGAALLGAELAGEPHDDMPPPVNLRTPAAPERDDDRLTRAEARRVSEAALRAVGGGVVVEVDRSDDPGEAYEVEVLRGGAELDVALDARLREVPNRRYGD